MRQNYKHNLKLFKLMYYYLDIKLKIEGVNYNNAGNSRKYSHINYLCKNMDNLDVI